MVRRRASAALLAVLVLACASPTLPLPPPGIPTQAMVDSTHVKLVSNCGGVEPRTNVTVTNQTRTDPTMPGVEGLIVLASTCGSWGPVTVYATAGDQITIVQSSDTADVSLPTTVIVGVP
jgi:hypothetical protein